MENKGYKILSISLLLFSVLMTSCGQELTQYETSVKTPVVESYIKLGDNQLTVKVYTMESFNEDDSQFSKAIKGLNVYVNNDLLTETSSGTYTLSNISEFLSGTNECQLRFEYNNKTIAASTNIPAKPVGLNISQTVIDRTSSWYYSDSIPEVIVSWDNPDNSYYQIYIQSLSETSGSTQAPSGMGGGFGKMMMQPVQDNSYTLKMHDMSFAGFYRCVLYKITKDYAELYERMSSTDLANPVSFIDNGLGIFTAYSADTILYKVVYSE